MKKIVLLLYLAHCTLFSSTIDIEDINAWNSKVTKPIKSDTTPLASGVFRVSEPSRLLHNISSAFDAKVISIEKNIYESVKKGDILATIYVEGFIDEQKSFIDTTLELAYAKDELLRKNELCKEQVIAQKECNLAKNTFDRLQLQQKSKELLLSRYGATKQMIQKMSAVSKIYEYIDILSPVDGVIRGVDVTLGKNIEAREIMFELRENGDNFLVGELDKNIAKELKIAEDVLLNIDTKTLKSKVLALSPSLNPNTQSRYVRLSLPSGFLDNDILKLDINLYKNSLKLPKSSLAKDELKDTLFVLKDSSFYSVHIELLYEDRDYIYIEKTPELENALVAYKDVNMLQHILLEHQDE
ncbi:MAG: efflux RND transporter periplasmic adaptor subunit [Sulfurimonas sp.]|nr:efflux RND transporter periplasmic adaptor subunit [Sulfurimonadaceae bacterium]